MTQKWLYTGVLLALVFLVFAALGQSFWGSVETGWHWTEKLFYGICHQMPDRTFHLNGNPMAVNTRCFGIFAGFLAGWVMIPFVRSLTLEKKWLIWFVLLAGMLQIIDVTGNLIHLWENTNISRALLGGVFGIAGPLVVADQFYNN